LKINTFVDYLPLYVVERIREYGDENGLSENEVAELAIAHFFNMKVLSFEGCNFESLGQMKEIIAILEVQLAALRGESDRDS
jgi:hypothetical protein